MDFSRMTEAIPATDQFTPIYYRIQEAMRRRIVEGEFQPGARLPSESELARDFGTTRVTVRHALIRLVYDGLIERRSGRGTFVRESSSIVSRIDTLMVHSYARPVRTDKRSVGKEWVWACRSRRSPDHEYIKNLSKRKQLTS